MEEKLQTSVLTRVNYIYHMEKSQLCLILSTRVPKSEKQTMTGAVQKEPHNEEMRLPWLTALGPNRYQTICLALERRWSAKHSCRHVCTVHTYLCLSVHALGASYCFSPAP